MAVHPFRIHTFLAHPSADRDGVFDSEKKTSYFPFIFKEISKYAEHTYSVVESLDAIGVEIKRIGGTLDACIFACHGTPYTMNFNEKGGLLTEKTIARIPFSALNERCSIVLLSCNTGRGGPFSLAAKIAFFAKKNVLAPAMELSSWQIAISPSFFLGKAVFPVHIHNGLVFTEVADEVFEQRIVAKELILTELEILKSKKSLDLYLTRYAKRHRTVMLDLYGLDYYFTPLFQQGYILEVVQYIEKLFEEENELSKYISLPTLAKVYAYAKSMKNEKVALKVRALLFESIKNASRMPREGIITAINKLIEVRDIEAVLHSIGCMLGTEASTKDTLECVSFTLSRMISEGLFEEAKMLLEKAEIAPFCSDLGYAKKLFRSLIFQLYHKNSVVISIARKLPVSTLFFDDLYLSSEVAPILTACLKSYLIASVQAILLDAIDLCETLSLTRNAKKKWIEIHLRYFLQYSIEWRRPASFILALTTIEDTFFVERSFLKRFASHLTSCYDVSTLGGFLLQIPPCYSEYITITVMRQYITQRQAVNIRFLLDELCGAVVWDRYLSIDDPLRFYSKKKETFVEMSALALQEMGHEAAKNYAKKHKLFPRLSLLSTFT